MRMNRGKSAALRRGLGAAKGDVIVLMDADGQDDPSELPRLLAALDGTAEGIDGPVDLRSEEHTSELQSLMRTSYAVFCLKKKRRDRGQHMTPTPTKYNHTEE